MTAPIRRIMRAIASAARWIHGHDIDLTDRFLSDTPLHQGFWVHRRRVRSMASRAHLAHGVLLDVGCGNKPFLPLLQGHVTRYWGVEYAPGSGYRGNRADAFGDAAALPIRTASVDTVLATELLEHVPDPNAVVAEIARVLRPGGIVLCTAPYFYPTHDTYDFFRFGPAAAATLMRRNGLEVTEILPLSGSGLTVGILFNLFWYELGFMWTPWLYPIGIVLRPLLWVALIVSNVVARLMELAIPSRHMSFNHLTVARKPE